MISSHILHISYTSCRPQIYNKYNLVISPKISACLFKMCACLLSTYLSIMASSSTSKSSITFGSSLVSTHPKPSNFSLGFLKFWVYVFRSVFFKNFSLFKSMCFFQSCSSSSSHTFYLCWHFCQSPCIMFSLHPFWLFPCSCLLRLHSCRFSSCWSTVFLFSWFHQAFPAFPRLSICSKFLWTFPVTHLSCAVRPFLVADSHSNSNCPPPKQPLADALRIKLLLLCTFLFSILLLPWQQFCFPALFLLLQILAVLTEQISF